MNTLKKLGIATVSAVILSGCQTFDAYTGEQKVNKATTYGAIGAVVCGAIGSRKDGKRARQSALACGLIGAGVGAYMDEQERILRQELVNSGVQVAREGDNIRLVIPNNITFEVNKSNLNFGIYNTLNSVAKVLFEYKETRLEVGGHTDSTGSSEYNDKLSLERARNVADYLISKKILRERLSVVGYGENHPIATNNTKAGRAQNRRVTLLIVPQLSS